MDTQNSKIQDQEGDELVVVIEEASPYKKLKTETEGSKDKIVNPDKAMSLNTGENSSQSGQNGQHFLSDESDIEVNPKNSKIKAQKSENKTLNKKRGKDEMEGQDQKDPKTKTQGKNSKLQEKSKDKDKRRQLQLDLMMEPKEQKSEKARQRAENEKIMSEIAKKYPEYVSDGRWKFPIEDKMFSQYASLLAEHIPKIERPKPQRGFIKPQDLGDILKIWNFFDTFSAEFKVDDVQKEEIYASLVYQGDEPLGLLNDMHQGLLSLFLKEIINRNQFDSVTAGHSVPIIPLLKNHLGTDTLGFNGDELALFWTEFARTLSIVAPFDNLLSETTKRFFDTLAKKTCLEYNKLEYRIKVRILNSLIDGLYETDIFKDMLQAKIEAAEGAVKEKSDVQAEIKEYETELKELKTKANQLANEAGKDSRSYSKAIDDVTRQESLINKKKQRLSALEIQIRTAIQPAALIGVDVHKSEYWVFQAEPNKLYVRIPEIILTEEEWYYYDKPSELNQLIDSLNPKGIKEKNLLEALQDLINTGRLVFDSNNNNKENVVPEQTDNKSGKMDEDYQADMLYWIGKVMEYDQPPTAANSEARTTRRRQKQQQNKDTGKPKPRTFKDLTIQTIKALILETEEKFQLYCERWGSWWALPQAKEQFMVKIFEAQTVDEVRDVLLEFHEKIKFAFSPRGKKDEANDQSEEEDDIEDANSKGTEVLHDDESSKSRTTDQESKITPGQNFGNTPSSKLRQPDDMEIEAQYKKIRKIPMRFWGMFGDRMKNNWVNFTSNVDNIAALYFSTLIFCDVVNKYVDRMTVKYFTIYNNGKEYMEAKWGKKKEVKEATPIVEEKRQLRNRPNYKDYDYEYDQSPEQYKPRRNDREMNMDYLESFKHSKKVVSKGTKVVRDSGAGGKSTAESDVYSGRLRSRSRTPSEERTFTSSRGQDKKGQLDQLANNARRSGRLAKNYREVESEEEAEYQDISEQEEEEVPEFECQECQGTEGRLMSCAECENSYHPRCVGLRIAPRDAWTCEACQATINKKQNARSSSRRVRISS